MAQQFGLTAQGFIAMQQQDVITDLQTALQALFGQNLNFSNSSILSQFVGIMSERFALIWSLGEAIYSSQYPSGAEGTSVDNILALNNLKRLTPKATITAPLPVTGPGGIAKWPLVLFGVPGTPIDGGSIIQTNASPPLSFTLDKAVVINPAQNAVQAVYFGNQPDTGVFQLSIADPSGETLTLAQSPFNVLANQSQLDFSSVPTTGNMTLTLTQAGAALTTGAIAFNATAANVQTAIRALSGYSSVTVSGSFSAGFVFTWGAIANPVLTVATNTLQNGTSSVTTDPVDSVQGTINNALDSVQNKYPYTDVVVGGSFAAGFVFGFGEGAVVGSNPVSSAQQQSLMLIATNTLQNGSTVTNMNVVTVTQGLPAQAVGSATCSSKGPNFVGAGALSVIGTPTDGWTGVTNQLDCISGANTETDTDAMVRRSNSLAENANGPIQSIAEKVAAVTGVTSAKPFQNQTGAANQLITFGGVPSVGAFKVMVGFQLTGSLPYNVTAGQLQTAIQALSGYADVIVTGTVQYGFTIDFNGSMGGQAQPLVQVPVNTTGVSILTAFGRPANSFEIVVLGGDDTDIANAIYGSMPAGTKSYGNTTVELFDEFKNPVFIRFSRPTQIPIYVVINMLTDFYNTPGDPSSGVNPEASFNPATVATIQTDVVTTGEEVGTGGLVIGFGSNGLVGAFNSVPGIMSYTMFFGAAPNPTQNVNIQMLSEQIPVYEEFNVVVSWV